MIVKSRWRTRYTMATHRVSLYLRDGALRIAVKRSKLRRHQDPSFPPPLARLVPPLLGGTLGLMRGACLERTQRMVIAKRVKAARKKPKAKAKTTKEKAKAKAKATKNS